MKTSLTGIKPTGNVHLGNYLGAIKPALEKVGEYRSLYFVADYHALTSVKDAKLMQQYTYDTAATWLACGLDPKKTLLYRQSAIPEVFELTWVLACLMATGQLERGHAYKDAMDKGEAPNAGVFNYPVLMAADILLYDTDIVPVGRDQKQHLEVARDVAVRLNHIFGDGTVVVPDTLTTEAEMVPGLDGRKMSKSYNNVIPLWASSKEIRSLCLKIVTGSESLEEPKKPEGSHVYELYRLFAPREKTEEMANALRAGGYGWGHAKIALFEELDRMLAPIRERYAALRPDEDRLDAILSEGEEAARTIAHATMKRVREATGIRRRRG